MTEKTTVKVAILTPYLVETIEETHDEDYVRVQREKFGYERENFAALHLLETPKHCVGLETSEDHILEAPELSDLAIFGSAREAEKNVKSIKGSGCIVARYSIFYGRCSGYSGDAPESAGYSLDIPKRVDSARALITDDKVLEALLLRDEEKLRAAIHELNKKLPAPILVTPYLSEAIRIERRIMPRAEEANQLNPLDMLFPFVPNEGKKLSSIEEYVKREGFSSLFAPGLTPQDLASGRIIKPVLFIEDNAELRARLCKTADPTALKPFAVPSLDEAVKLLEFNRNVCYAVIDDSFPRTKDSRPLRLADEAFDLVKSRFPEAQMFAFVDEPEGLSRSYKRILLKNEVSPEEVVRVLVEDAEAKK